MAGTLARVGCVMSFPGGPLCLWCAGRFAESRRRPYGRLSLGWPAAGLGCGCRVSAGDGYVVSDDRRVVEQGEQAGGQVGAGDRESVRQVAVDRGAVGSGGWLAGQRGRAEDRPVQVAVPDLVLAAAHVGADMAGEG